MLRRCVVVRAAPTADATAQWPFGRPEARGTARKYIPYAKTTLEGLAAKMADKKQDPPRLVSLMTHLTGLGKGWKIARNHWNLDGEVKTFATITDAYNFRPPYELSQVVGYMTVNGETSNCPLYIPQQQYTGWTVIAPPEREDIDAEFTDRTGRVVDFSNKIIISGIDYTTSLRDVESYAKECGTLQYCQFVPEAYDKATKSALVIYEDINDAKAAYEELHDMELDGLRLAVHPGVYAVPRPPSIGVEVPVDFSFGRMPTEPSFNW